MEVGEVRLLDRVLKGKPKNRLGLFKPTVQEVKCLRCQGSSFEPLHSGQGGDFSEWHAVSGTVDWWHRYGSLPIYRHLFSLPNRVGGAEPTGSLLKAAAVKTAAWASWEQREASRKLKEKQAGRERAQAWRDRRAL